MIIIDFTYYCIFNIISNRALFGKKESAATFHAALYSFFVIGIILWLIYIFKITINSTLFMILYSIDFIGFFIFNEIYFINDKKQEHLFVKFNSLMNKNKFKLIGIVLSIFVLVFFLATLICIRILKLKN